MKFQAGVVETSNTGRGKIVYLAANIYQISQMSLNTHLIDQQVKGVVDRMGEELRTLLNAGRDETRLKSAAYVLLVTKQLLAMNEADALDCLVEGGNDFGVDAIHVGPVQDAEFMVTLVQGKYSSKLDVEANFPRSGIEKLIQAVGVLFDPSKKVELNPRLNARVEEIRSLISDGNIPQVKAIACNNGIGWDNEADQLIKQAFGPIGQVAFGHIGADQLVKLLQSNKPVNGSLSLYGKAMVESFDFRRVLVGRVPVAELARVFEEAGDRLLERNIRRYLGLHGNRVNQAIHETLLDKDQQANFYFYNNGITITCTQFSYNALQDESWQVKLNGMQVINGGQTCRTILHALKNNDMDTSRASVLVRIYELPDEERKLVQTITYATNSQNPVDLRDLRSDDAVQQKLEKSIEGLGFRYRRQRSQDSIGPKEITSAVAAEAILATWLRRPHQARFRRAKLFDEPLYSEIFPPDCNGAQVVLAVLIFRFAENRRKRPAEDAKEFIPYASHFIAMLMSRYLLADLGIKPSQLDHRNFDSALRQFEGKDDRYYLRALQDLEMTLDKKGQDEPNYLQWLSAQFRRADLVLWLDYLTPASPDIPLD